MELRIPQLPLMISASDFDLLELRKEDAEGDGEEIESIKWTQRKYSGKVNETWEWKCCIEACECGDG